MEKTTGIATLIVTGTRKLDDKEIDEIISSHLTGKWKIERLNKVSLGIMRLAVYELKYLDDIPANVTINEAVELSKKFSGEDEYKFVNGVLGAIARNL